MKATRLMRRVDTLGRVIIPKILRHKNNIETGDLIEILLKGEQLILRKFRPNCTFCGEAVEEQEMKSFKGRAYCHNCSEQLRCHVRDIHVNLH